MKIGVTAEANQVAVGLPVKVLPSSSSCDSFFFSVSCRFSCSVELRQDLHPSKASSSLTASTVSAGEEDRPLCVGVLGCAHKVFSPHPKLIVSTITSLGPLSHNEHTNSH